jgi:hypothetical protein
LDDTQQMTSEARDAAETRVEPPARAAFESEREAFETERGAFETGQEASESVRQETSESVRGVEATPSPSITPLRLQDALAPRADARYHVEELFSFHDRAFVESAFAAALSRAPTARELEATLAELRASRRSKSEIIEDLCETEEGRRVGARERIVGVGEAGWKRRVRRLPVVGYLWQLLSSVVRLPTALRHRQEFETYALAQQQLIADHFNEQQRRLARLFDEQGLLLHAQLADELHRAVADANAAISILADALAEMSARLSEAQHGVERRLNAQQDFLTQEQHAIVEAQKAVLAEIEARLGEVLETRDRALAELTRQVRERRASPEVAHDAQAAHDAEGTRVAEDAGTP